MVEYYAARRKEGTGRWDYTCANSAGTFALGYCSGYREWKPQDFTLCFDETFARKEAERLNEKYAPYKEKFHSDGHETAAEAHACYVHYRLDHELVFSAKEDEDTREKCAVCQKWTGHGAWFTGHDHKYWALCPEHQTKDTVRGLLGL